MSFNAKVSYTANGSNATFAITFSFIDSTHVKVFLDGVSTTAFSVSGSNVIMNSNPANGVVVLIKRETPTNARLVDFQDGSVLTESDLDKSADQNFFIAQEINDESQSAMKLATDDTFDALNKRIKNVADPVNNNDAVNKGFISTNLANINTVAGISSQVTNVANNLSAINTANSNSANVITKVVRLPTEPGENAHTLNDIMITPIQFWGQLFDGTDNGDNLNSQCIFLCVTQQEKLGATELDFSLSLVLLLFSYVQERIMELSAIFSHI